MLCENELARVPIGIKTLASGSVMLPLPAEPKSTRIERGILPSGERPASPATADEVTLTE